MTHRQELIERFRDREYREAYVNAFLDSRLATQIRAIRQHRDLTQQELAARIGSRQSRISSFEDPDYSAWSLSSLRRLAAAFDVALEVRFVAYGELIGEIAEFNESVPLVKVSFDQDRTFAATAPKTMLEFSIGASTGSRGRGPLVVLTPFEPKSGPVSAAS